jgi:hypothetical protein
MGIRETLHEAAELERLKRELRGESSATPTSTQYVHIVDIKMPFWSMVVFIIKVSLASIPAVLFMWLFYVALTAIITVAK